MSNVIEFRLRGYTAKEFRSGAFVASGTLCSCVDFHDGTPGTWSLTVPEIDALIAMLKGARDDVVANSRPFTDPRIIG